MFSPRRYRIILQNTFCAWHLPHKNPAAVQILRAKKRKGRGMMMRQKKFFFGRYRSAHTHMENGRRWHIWVRVHIINPFSQMEKTQKIIVRVEKVFSGASRKMWAQRCRQILTARPLLQQTAGIIPCIFFSRKIKRKNMRQKSWQFDFFQSVIRIFPRDRR